MLKKKLKQGGRKIQILEHLVKGSANFDEIQKAIKAESSTLSSSLYTLKSGGLVSQDSGHGSAYSLTSQGKTLVDSRVPSTMISKSSKSSLSKLPVSKSSSRRDELKKSRRSWRRAKKRAASNVGLDAFKNVLLVRRNQIAIQVVQFGEQIKAINSLLEHL